MRKSAGSSRFLHSNIHCRGQRSSVVTQKCGPWTSSLGIWGKLIRDAGFQLPFHSCWIRICAWPDLRVTPRLLLWTLLAIFFGPLFFFFLRKPIYVIFLKLEVFVCKLEPLEEFLKNLCCMDHMLREFDWIGPRGWPEDDSFSEAAKVTGEGNGNPLQYSCLENPMDGGAWWAAVHGVAQSRTWLSDFTFTFHFHALEKEMATHSSVLAWRIPGTVEPGGLPSMGSHRVGHNWRDSSSSQGHYKTQLRQITESRETKSMNPFFSKKNYWKIDT